MVRINNRRGKGKYWVWQGQNMGETGVSNGEKARRVKNGKNERGNT